MLSQFFEAKMRGQDSKIATGDMNHLRILHLLGELLKHARRNFDAKRERGDGAFAQEAEPRVRSSSSHDDTRRKIAVTQKRGKKGFQKNLGQMATVYATASHSIGFSRSTRGPTGDLMKAMSCYFAHKCATRQNATVFLVRTMMHRCKVSRHGTCPVQQAPYCSAF